MFYGFMWFHQVSSVHISKGFNWFIHFGNCHWQGYAGTAEARCRVGEALIWMETEVVLREHVESSWKIETCFMADIGSSYIGKTN